MLGRRDPQGQLFTATTMLGEEGLQKLGFHGKVAREGRRVFRDDDSAGIYCADNGRPSAPPSLLALARAAGCEGEETKLLQQVVEQDVDREGPGGSPRVRQGVAKRRMPSVNDSDLKGLGAG